MNATPVPRRLVGLTGGIGSGKSTVAQMLVARGCELVDADQISKSITRKGGAALGPIARVFGQHMLDSSGDLNRDGLRDLVFKDPAARKQLEAITHPLVSEHIALAVSQTRSAVVLLDIPLLVESGKWRHVLDQVIVIDCDRQTQHVRVRDRNGWSAETINAVLNAQADRVSRLATADHVICNDGIHLEQLASQVGVLASRLGL